MAPTPTTTDPFVILNDAIRDLLSSYQGTFVNEGRHLYAGLALIILSWFFIKSALGSGVQWDRFAGLILFLSFGYSMTEFYATPIPGVGKSFSGLIVEQGSWMADIIGTRGVEELIDKATMLSENMGKPSSPVYVGDWLAWLAASAFLVLLVIAAYLVIAFALVAQAVLLLLGPIFVPFFIVPKLDTLFWSWFRCLISYSFMQVVARAFILVFGRVFLSFADLYRDSWSVQQLSTVVPVLGIFAGIALVGIFKVPAFTNQIFSGVSGLSFGILEGGTETAVSVVTSVSGKAATGAVGG